MAAEGKKKNYTLEVIAVIVLIYWLWTGYNKRKLATISPPVTEPALEPEVDNCNVDPFKCNPVPCEEFIYKPLAPFDIQRGGTLNIPKGTCFRGDGSMYADSPNGFGSDYAEQQAQEYSDIKQAEAIQNINKKVITFKLINSTAVKETVQVLDTTQDSAPFDPAPITPTSGTINDIDGNEYHWITIGSQQWLVENLKTTKYNDGSDITKFIDDAGWMTGFTSQVPGYGWYANDIANKDPYGALYNWLAVVNPKGIAPSGFRVASAGDWDVLAAFLGGYAQLGTLAGGLKEVGLTHWKTPNFGATNVLGFTAVGNGIHLTGSGDFYLTEHFQVWTSTPTDVALAEIRYIYYDSDFIDFGSLNKAHGFGVRCVRDI